MTAMTTPLHKSWEAGFLFKDDINHALPADLILEIFQHLGEQDAQTSTGRRAKFTHRKLPPGVAYSSLIRAASVCQRWRYLIHTTSSFWSRVFIIDSDGSALQDFLKWQVGLAQDQPLHITNEIYGAQEMFSAEIISVLLGCSRQWTTLKLTAPLPVVVSLLSVPMPQLEHLQFRCVRLPEHQNTMPPSASSMTIDAPHLAHVKLYNVDILPIGLPWWQLKSFSFDTSTVLTSLPFLRDVEHLEMNWKERDFAHAWSHPDIQLPRLHHISLQCYDTTTFLDTHQTELSYLPSSSISTLGLSLVGTVRTEQLGLLKQSLLPFVLTTLHIRELQSPANHQLVAALQDLDGLQHLQIDDGFFINVDGLLDELCHNMQFLPVLAELALYFVNFTFAKAKEMVHARVGRTTTAGKPIRTVRIMHLLYPRGIERKEEYSPHFLDADTTVYVGKNLY